jgi:hypothetical protein
LTPRYRIVFCLLALATLPVRAQRHGGSPPTAPARPAPAPVAVSTGLGPIQFVAVNYGVPAPQSLSRQLRSDDDRTRASALSAIGVPGQYLQHGRVPMPHSIEVSLVQLSAEDELDALVTIELDQHIVTAILVPDGDNWRRVATVFVADPFADLLNTPSSFVRTERALVNHSRYRAVFHAAVSDGHGSITENEVQLRVINRRAQITISFVSRSRDCTAPIPAAGKRAQPSSGCSVLTRWMQPDPADPLRQFLLVSATGHMTNHEVGSLIGANPIFDDAYLRTFSCQPFVFSDQTGHFEPTGNSVTCNGK